MTAVAMAMLGIVLLATAVLVAVGAAHELTTSARGRRFLRRARYRMQARTDDAREATARGLRAGRRELADRLARPVPPLVPQRVDVGLRRGV